MAQIVGLVPKEKAENKSDAETKETKASDETAKTTVKRLKAKK